MKKFKEEVMSDDYKEAAFLRKEVDHLVAMAKSIQDLAVGIISSHDRIMTGEVEALLHEGRQGELEMANVGLATEIEELKAALRFAAGYISGTEQFKDRQPMDVYDWLIEEAGKDAEAVKAASLRRN